MSFAACSRASEMEGPRFAISESRFSPDIKIKTSFLFLLHFPNCQPKDLFFESSGLNANTFLPHHPFFKNHIISRPFGIMCACRYLQSFSRSLFRINNIIKIFFIGIFRKQDFFPSGDPNSVGFFKGLSKEANNLFSFPSRNFKRCFCSDSSKYMILSPSQSAAVSGFKSIVSTARSAT